MRARYARRADGTTIKTADVYTREEHAIPTRLIDHDAIRVVRRLQTHGFEAYVVGGAVRDLLLGREPKDFDVSTSATPNQIRRLFRNSRIIGKRFRLAHLLFADKVIEVSTFRSEEAEGFKNVYGTIDEDVRRRDFTCNALFYDPVEQTIVDFVGGVRDIRRRVLKPVIPLQRIFREDPVRMIRAVKYATSGGMRIPWQVRRRISTDRAVLAETPASRMTEELFKILGSGSAAPIVSMLIRFRLFEYVVPKAAALAGENAAYRKKLIARLESLDARRAAATEDDGVPEITRGDMLFFLTADFLLEHAPFVDQQRIPFRDAFSAVKTFISPSTPANREVEVAVELTFANKGRLLRNEDPDLDDTGRRRRRRRGGRRRPKRPADAAQAGSEE